MCVSSFCLHLSVYVYVEPIYKHEVMVALTGCDAQHTRCLIERASSRSVALKRKGYQLLVPLMRFGTDPSSVPFLDPFFD